MTASVYLCGFMGCGKSHIGRLLATELGRELVDLDKVIVDREGYFREVRRAALPSAGG